jgi:hypothetical protein
MSALFIDDVLVDLASFAGGQIGKVEMTHNRSSHVIVQAESSRKQIPFSGLLGQLPNWRISGRTVMTAPFCCSIVSL